MRAGPASEQIFCRNPNILRRVLPCCLLHFDHYSEKKESLFGKKMKENGGGIHVDARGFFASDISLCIGRIVSRLMAEPWPQQNLCKDLTADTNSPVQSYVGLVPGRDRQATHCVDVLSPTFADLNRIITVITK